LPWGFRFANGRRFFPRSYYFSEAFTGDSPYWRRDIARFLGGEYRYNLCCTTFWQGRLLKQSHNELVDPRAICCAWPGERYVCYSPSGQPIRIDLTAASGSFAARWLNPRSGKRAAAGTMRGGETRTLRSPFPGDAVLDLQRR